MKSRKLFAILTLVAFMMTLVPALAFGAANYDASICTVGDPSKESLKVGKTSEVSVRFYDTNGDRLAENSPIGDLWVKASRGGVEIVVDKSYVEEDENAVFDLVTDVPSGLTLVPGVWKTGKTLKTDRAGTVKFKITSDIAKPVTLSFWGDYASLANDEDYNCIGEVKIDFTPDEGRVSSVELWNDTGNVAAGEKITLTARVEDNTFNGLKGRLVTFYKRNVDGGSWIRIDSKETNSDGEVEISYYEENAGTYDLEARCTGKSSTSNNVIADQVVVSPGAAATIEAVTADGKVFDVTKVGNVKFIVRDNYGNKKTDANPGSLIDVTFVSVPKDSDLEDSDIEYSLDQDDEYELIAGIPFDEVGDYKLKARIAGFGKYIPLTVTAKEAGETEDIVVKFKKDGEKSLIAGDFDDNPDSLVLDVKLVDEFGIEIDADDYKAYSSDVSLVKVKTTASGKLTLEGPKDDKKRGVAKITVVDLDTSKTASIDVPVVGKPYAIDTDYVVSGKTANVTLQYVDNDGVVTRAKGSGDIDYELLVSNGVVVTEKKKFKEASGEASFKATVEEYGEYNVTVVSGQGIAKKFTLVVGVPDSEKEIIGAKSITMFIGSSGYVQDGVAKITDVAPFIKDDRTFVAIRPVADAFGCEIGWDEVEQKVTLVRDDIVVTINIGSSDIEVVEDGVVSVVEADVAAFIEDGRTVLPFRAVGNAFGATVDYDEVTQSVTYTQS